MSKRRRLPAIVLTVLLLVPIIYPVLRVCIFSWLLPTPGAVDPLAKSYIWSTHQYEELLLNSVSFLRRFWISLRLAVVITLGQLLVACLTGFGLARVRGYLARVAVFVEVLLMLMPFQVLFLPNYLALRFFGLFNTEGALIWPAVFSSLGTYLIFRYIRRLPAEMMEQAQIDGANEWDLFTRIVLPNITGVILTVVILVFVDAWNMVEQPVLFILDRDRHPLSVFLSYIIASDQGVSNAGAVIYMLPALFLFLLVGDKLRDSLQAHVMH